MKKLLIILLLLPTLAWPQKGVTFTLDARNIGKPSKFTIEGRVLLKKTKPDKSMIVVLVNLNRTYHIKVVQKSLFTLIREREYLTLTNLTIEQ